MIKLSQHYRGVHTQEQLIVPGTYADDDPALFGLAGYLVDMGFASRVEEAVVELTDGAVELLKEHGLTEQLGNIPFEGDKVTKRDAQAFIDSLESESD